MTNQKRRTLFAMILCFFLGALSVHASEQKEFRVGMEAAYAPFNWTQYDNSNGAVPIQGVGGQFANGYDVQVSKSIAEKLGKKLVIVKSSWDGLLPALTSGKIDAIVAGMSPTEERKQQISFSIPYYQSNLVLMVNRDGKFKNAKTLKDFSNAKVTAQVGTFHYSVIDQIPDVAKQPAMKDFSSMRVALQSNAIDAYVAERPEGITAEAANRSFKMIDFKDDTGFKTDSSDTTVAVGVRKDDPDLPKINEYLQSFTLKKQQSLMDEMINKQPSVGEEKGWFDQIKSIIHDNGAQFLRGTGMTLFISLIGTVVGTIIGLLIGVYRTRPVSDRKVFRIFHRIINWLITVYIEVFRGTPMIVQAMVLYYGTALAFGWSIDRTLAALLIVSINTGSYMSEIVRGGIFSVDDGQFEAAQALGMTHAQLMRKIVLPQVLRNILPATGNEFVINIKDTSVLSVISVTELFFQGTTVAQQNFMYFQTFAIICVIYFVLTFTITRLLRLVEIRMDGPDAYVPIGNQMQVEAIHKNGGQ